MSRLDLTGRLGEVMKESAQIALTFVPAHAAELGLDETALASLGGPIHLHVPAGAVPKDRPSVSLKPAARSAARSDVLDALTGHLVGDVRDILASALEPVEGADRAAA